MSEEGLKNRRKLELGFILSLIVIILIVTWIYMNNVRKVLSNQNQVHIKEVTAQNANNISEKLNSTFTKLEMINESIIYKEGLSLDNKLNLVNLRKIDSEFEDVLIVNSEGIGINTDRSLISIKDIDCLGSILSSSERIVLEPCEEVTYAKDTVLYSVPILKNDKVIGFTIGISKPEILIKQLSTNIYEDKGNSLIVDRNSKVLFSNKKELMGKNLYDDVTLKEISRNNNNYKEVFEGSTQGAIKENLNGKNVFLGFSEIPYTEGWYVVNLIAEEDIFQTAKQGTEPILILATGIVLVLMIVGGYLVKNQKELKKVAFLDKLTKISNRDKFIFDMKDYIGKRKNKKCISICFDIDKFKIINDIYGHQAGDEVLKTISNNLKKCFGSMAVYGRLEDDVFGLVVEYTGKEKELESLINVIKYEIINMEKNKLINSQFNIEVCIGVYLIENNKKNIDKIISNANMARQKSKESMFKEAIIFDEKLREEKQQMIQLEKDLFYAIENNELCVYYQPKFNIHTGVIVGAEALIRWEHSKMGMISPMIFIPIAEKNKYINKIGRWVFQKVCKTLRDFIDCGIDVVPVAVNISRVELYQPDLVETFKMNLKKYNIPPELIEIEITETTALNNTNFINLKISEIKSLGIKVAMDDFGTGNSNLSNLKDVPIDILKIDRSLLKDIEKNTKSEVMVSSIVSLSNNLNLGTICEGVENANQIDILKKTSCEVVQGYVFAKPMEEHKYEALLRLNEQKIG